MVHTDLIAIARDDNDRGYEIEKAATKAVLF